MSHFRGGRSFGRSGSSRFGRQPFRRRASPGRFHDTRIDVTKYINKNVIKETTVPYEPAHLFNDFVIEEKLKSNITAKGYVKPTPIQDQSIPVILEGKDIVGIANTGTGKTAAFLIPLINKVLKDKKQQIVIVAPTRELAQQINAELISFTKNMGVYSVCAVGGASAFEQVRKLRYFNNFVVGTPGRIKDLSQRKALNLSQFKTVVLDEADRMLDMGFIADMKFMLAQMPSERHTLFFSATLSPTIERLIQDFLKNPVRVSVKTQDTSKNVHQDIIRFGNHEAKIDVLHNLLSDQKFERVLIFGKTKHGVEKLSKTLEQRGFKSTSIHGNKSQGQRQRALRDFKENRVKILVATDVAARGLDIPDISHVINYDIPSTHEDYVHRIGRTGRGEKKGSALTFVE